MVVKIKLRKEIEIRLRRDKTLQNIITKRLERESGHKCDHFCTAQGWIGKKNFNVADREVLEPFRERAIKILKDIDPGDVQFLALAMALNCPIWSNDKDLKKQKVVKVYTTQKIPELLK